MKRVKTGGRKAGTKNIRSPIVADTLRVLNGGDGMPGFDPIKELVECYHRCANTDGVMHIAVRCLEVLMPYVHSKLSPEPFVQINNFTPINIQFHTGEIMTIGGPSQAPSETE